MIELKEICKVQCGFAFDSKKFTEDSSYYPLIRIRDVKRGFTQTYYTGEFSSEYIVHKGDLLVGMDGEFNIARWNSDDALLNQRVCRIIANNNVNEEYLRFYLKRTLKLIESKTSFVTVKHLSTKELNGLRLNLPCMETQQCISKQLSTLELMIQKNKKVLELLDELVKARFVEMFGEYETSVKLSRYIKELRAGKSLAGKTKCKNKVLKTGAATFGFFDKEQYKYYPIDYVPNPLHKVEDGDVIISRMNTPELVGSCSYVFEAPEDMYYPDRLWKTIITEDTNPIFLWQLMWQQDIRKQIKENSFGTSGTMNNISKVKLLNIKAIDVPLELQEKYASFVQEIDKSRLLSNHSLFLIKSITF